MDDLERVARREFTAEHVSESLALLHTYSGPEESRVRLAVLKLAAGDLERLRAWVQAASSDYRDPLAAAEYPGYMQTTPQEMQQLSPEARRKIVEADHLQHQEWLKR